MDSEDIYRKDVVSQAPTRAQHELLLLCKYGGLETTKEQARHELLTSLLGIVMAYAAKQQREHCSFLELVSFGNHLLVVKLDEALTHINPVGYLLKTLWHEMREYRRQLLSVIALPSTPGDDPYDICEITPVFEEKIAEPLPSSEKTYAPLYEALATLPEQTRILLCRLYGLCGYARESLPEMCGGGGSTREYQAAKMRKLNALKRLRQYLEEHHPAFVQLHRQVSVKRKPALSHITLPECTLRKLQEAEKTLRAQGVKLSMNKLRTLSGVHTRYASLYLQRLEMLY